MNIEWIKEKIRNGDYELSGHAEEERQVDKISMDDLEAALLAGSLLERYPNDPRGPSCLVLGYGERNRPIHIVCGKTPRGDLRIITVYLPGSPKWKTERERG